MIARLGNLLSRLRTPVGCAAVLLFVAGDIALMGWAFPRERPATGLAQGRVFRDFRGPGNDYVTSLYVVREPDGGRTIIDETQSAAMLADLSQREPSRILSASYWRGSWYLGIIAPWQRREVSRLVVYEMASGEAPTNTGDAVIARRATSDWLLGRGEPKLSGEVAAGDFNTTTSVWWGPLNDAVVLGGVLVLISSIPLVPRWIRERGVRARLSCGICPACRYDLRATAAKGGRVVCPECGRTWDDGMLCRDGAPTEGS